MPQSDSENRKEILEKATEKEQEGSEEGDRESHTEQDKGGGEDC